MSGEKIDAPAFAAVQVVFTLQAMFFITVEVLAALALDGWLSWALFYIATWNVVVICGRVYGLTKFAADRANGESA